MEGLTGLLLWVGLLGITALIVALLVVGLVLGVLHFGMRFYYPDRHPSDGEGNTTDKGAKAKRP